MIPATWNITSTLDPARGFYHLVYRDVSIETADHVHAWVADLERRLEGSTDKVDVVIDLAGLAIKPALLRLYDHERQTLMGRYVRRVYRYSGNAMVRTRLLTSATLAGQAANVFATYDEAVAALTADRAKERR